MAKKQKHNLLKKQFINWRKKDEKDFIIVQRRLIHRYLILLGPQVRFQMEIVKKQVTCPVVSIDPVSYGTMNGEKVLSQAKKEMGD